MAAQAGEHGIVLSSGGGDGAYAVGVMQALFGGESPATGHQPIDPVALGGTSIGAFNAACLISQYDGDSAAAVAQLRRIWLEELAGGFRDNGIFRIRANPFQYLDPRIVASAPIRYLADLTRDSTFLADDWFRRATRFISSPESLERRLLELVNFSSLVSTDPFKRVIQKHVDFGRIRRSNKDLSILVTNSSEGKLEPFSKDQLTDEKGKKIILASAAVPGFLPAVDVDGVIYIDGAVLGYTKLAPVIEAGARTLHVIYVEPDVNQVPIHEVRSSLDTFYRVFMITWATRVNQGIEAVVRTNHRIKTLNRVRKEARLSEEHYDELLHSYLPRDRKKGEAPVEITLHRYHPAGDLFGPLGLLNLDRSRLEDLIEQGFKDAVNHDCEQCKCVLPSDG